MTTTFKWTTPEAITTILDTGLNSMADGSTALSSATIANETDLYTRINLELVLPAFDNHLVSAASMLIWFLATMDGTSYENGTAGTPGTFPQRSPDVLFPLPIQNANYAVRIVMPNIIIPPLSFKVFLASSAGGTLASSGNTLKYRRYNEQGV
jgi:hypothetical protein